MNSAQSVQYIALVPAAGVGARVGGHYPKQYLPVCGQPLLKHTLKTLLTHPAIHHVALILSPDDAYFQPEEYADLGDFIVLRVGGATRALSVTAGLVALAEKLTLADGDGILVHDAARPCLSSAALSRLIDTLHPSFAAYPQPNAGGLLALPVPDTLKLSDASHSVQHTQSRKYLYLAQTPQLFPYAILLQALIKNQHNLNITDESSAMENLGYAPRLIEGESRNFKVTYPSDLWLAELILGQSS
ncbi:MAG: 2-C-methyl-D-erythritol 4-phosphate cytidylyltransferase [Neisseriaceae bacterium]|nr:2-C-methyl-D-erythritol 4-phosphate cytidylyltransferase [Neisseriaceae bacterium]